MTLELLIEKFYYIVNFASKKKKLFFTWILIYLLSLILTIFYKFSHYEIDFKIKLFNQYTPMTSMHRDGMEALLYKFIKKDLKEYDINEDNYLLHIYINGNSKEEVINEANNLLQITGNFREEVILHVHEINKNLDKGYNDFKQNLKNKDFAEKRAFYNWYFPYKKSNELFINTFSKIYIVDDYEENNIKNIEINIFIKIISVYITIFYILNLLFLIFFQNYKKSEISKS
tara:strand:- start:315 stop:1004 length:690 start_codon:yes stop_codon:yes gene_type:complete